VNSYLLVSYRFSYYVGALSHLSNRSKVKTRPDGNTNEAGFLRRCMFSSKCGQLSWLL